MHPFPIPSESNGFLKDHVRQLRASFRSFTGQHLIDPNLDVAEGAKALWDAPFVILSHNTEADPIFTYANRTALNLFELDWEDLIILPSRKSAELPNREERARLLAEVTAHGFIQNYAGVRISKTGRRFMIDQATVWNLVNEAGERQGQAATFGAWKFLA